LAEPWPADATGFLPAPAGREAAYSQNRGHLSERPDDLISRSGPETSRREELFTIPKEAAVIA
jgi:hypothetical protein